MASRHRVRAPCLQIIKTATVPAALTKRVNIKQFHDSNISFPLTRRMARSASLPALLAYAPCDACLPGEAVVHALPLASWRCVVWAPVPVRVLIALCRAELNPAFCRCSCQHWRTHTCFCNSGKTNLRLWRAGRRRGSSRPRSRQCARTSPCTELPGRNGGSAGLWLHGHPLLCSSTCALLGAPVFLGTTTCSQVTHGTPAVL